MKVEKAREIRVYSYTIELNDGRTIELLADEEIEGLESRLISVEILEE